MKSTSSGSCLAFKCIPLPQALLKEKWDHLVTLEKAASVFQSLHLESRCRHICPADHTKVSWELNDMLYMKMPHKPQRST